MALFYFFFVVTDFVMMSFANEELYENDDYYCLEDNRLGSANDDGATFLLIFTLMLLGFSFMIWFIFYKLPDKYGLISKRNEQLGFRTREQSIAVGDISDITNLISITKDEIDPCISPKL